MVSNSAKLDCRTKQHTASGVSTSDGSRDMARTRSRRKKKRKKKEKRKKMNSWNPIKHPLRGSLIRERRGTEEGREGRAKKKTEAEAKAQEGAYER